MAMTTLQASYVAVVPTKAVSRPPTAVSTCLSGRVANGQHQLAGRATSARKFSSLRRRRNVNVAAAMPVTDVALVIPSLIPVLFRAFSAGLLLYSTLAWASARSDRKQVENNIAEQKARQLAQKAKLDRLRGTMKDNSTDNDK